MNEVLTRIANTAIEPYLELEKIKRNMLNQVSTCNPDELIQEAIKRKEQREARYLKSLYELEERKRKAQIEAEKQTSEDAFKTIEQVYAELQRLKEEVITLKEGQEDV